mmetsp:Transcript_5608/g.10710  ORF Transcript_5608/g.10710 Transcript_5608/m.10710 type:complete len:212 (+) Transcript_5608:454-1089(+)
MLYLSPLLNCVCGQCMCWAEHLGSDALSLVRLQIFSSIFEHGLYLHLLGGGERGPGQSRPVSEGVAHGEHLHFLPNHVQVADGRPRTLLQSHHPSLAFVVVRLLLPTALPARRDLVQASLQLPLLLEASNLRVALLAGVHRPLVAVQLPVYGSEHTQGFTHLQEGVELLLCTLEQNHAIRALHLHEHLSEVEARQKKFQIPCGYIIQRLIA